MSLRSAAKHTQRRHRRRWEPRAHPILQAGFLVLADGGERLQLGSELARRKLHLPRSRGASLGDLRKKQPTERDDSGKTRLGLPAFTMATHGSAVAVAVPERIKPTRQAGAAGLLAPELEGPPHRSLGHHARLRGGWATRRSASADGVRVESTSEATRPPWGLGLRKTETHPDRRDAFENRVRSLVRALRLRHGRRRELPRLLGRAPGGVHFCLSGPEGRFHLSLLKVKAGGARAVVRQTSQPKRREPGAGCDSGKSQQRERRTEKRSNRRSASSARRRSAASFASATAASVFRAARSFSRIFAALSE